MILYNKLVIDIKKIVFLFLIYAVLLITALIILLPIIVIISSSFKNEVEIFTFPMTIIPDKIIFTNFIKLIDKFPIYILNSFKLTIIIVVIQVITATTAGYAFSKLKWKGREFVFLLFVSSMMIPIYTYIIPQFIIIRNLGLYNSHLGIILISSFTAFGAFLCKQFFMTIPDSYLESAEIDGAGHFYIFAKIMLPLSKPVIATLIIFSFRYFWNDFFIPLIYLTTPNLKTLPLGMSDFVTETYTYTGPQMAASLISIIPVLIVFFIAQKYIIEGVAASGVKG
jgi:multiple sugar transport system permease protein